jgi:GT2 family glycosyltransferase
MADNHNVPACNAAEAAADAGEKNVGKAQQRRRSGIVMVEKSPVLSVIIVAWNSAPWIEPCLSSLMVDLQGIAGEVIVVDNASMDTTVDLIHRRFPQVRLLQNPHNAGFGRACNQALAISRGEFVLFLNPDTHIQPGMVQTLLHFLRAHPEAGAVGPTLLNPDGSLQLSGNSFPSLTNLWVEAFFLDRCFPAHPLFGGHKLSHVDRTVVREVDWVMGACLLAPQAVLEKIGGFDERFFLFFEDTDLCWRMRQAGYAVFFLPTARLVHFGGASPEHYTAPKILAYHHSLFLFARKYFRQQQQQWLRLLVWVRTLIRLGGWIGLLPFFRQAALQKIVGYGAVLKMCLRREEMMHASDGRNR